jgi:hypothetical protein
VDIAILLKIGLTLIVLFASVWVIFSRSEWSGRTGLLAGISLVLMGGASFTVANIVNLQVEEAYGFAPMVLCWAMLIDCSSRAAAGDRREGDGGTLRSILFGVSLVLIYLSKSSYLAVVFVLLTGFGLLNGFRTRQFVICTVILTSALLSWGLYQKHNSGRFSFGTSLDGWNLYKGNNPQFNTRYPPSPGTSLDQYDEALFQGGPVGDEWEVSDYYFRESVKYAINNPRAWAIGVLKKLQVAFIAMEKSGSTKSTGFRHYYEFLSLLLLRIVLWVSIAISVIKVYRGARNEVLVGCIYIGFVFFLLLPYLAGFLYTRHLSVLGIPAAMLVSHFVVPRCDRIA